MQKVSTIMDQLKDVVKNIQICEQPYQFCSDQLVPKTVYFYHSYFQNKVLRKYLYIIKYIVKQCLYLIICYSLGDHKQVTLFFGFPILKFVRIFLKMTHKDDYLSIYHFFLKFRGNEMMLECYVIWKIGITQPNVFIKKCYNTILF